MEVTDLVFRPLSVLERYSKTFGGDSGQVFRRMWRRPHITGEKDKWKI